MTGVRIDEGAFRNLAIYMREEPTGPVYSVVFKNPEYATGWREGVRGIVWLVLLLSVFPAFVYARESGMWVMLVWLAAIVAYAIRVRKEDRVSRAVELDYPRDRLRILYNGRVETEQPISRLSDLTVDEHPDAAFRRMRRQEKGDKRLSAAEQQHCLYGWFGPGGAEKLVLLTRAEWPCRNTLMEVRAAMLWVAKYAEGSFASQAASERRPQQRGAGIKPPLD